MMDSTLKNPPGCDLSANSYPLAAYLRFSPGGIIYANRQIATDDDDGVMISNCDFKDDCYMIDSTDKSNAIQRAREADDRLRQYCLLYSQNSETAHYLPSLSALADAAFGRLTGCSPDSAREWADAMVCQYVTTEISSRKETIPMSEDDVWNSKPNGFTGLSHGLRTVEVLKKIAEDSEERRHQIDAAASKHLNGSNTSRKTMCRPRPCGYVFKRGDIAWNCRTCQTDPTCVICNECFRNSDHQGHEVYFHRTSPGGCCDCGDAEAWSPNGCCSKHKPESDVGTSARNTSVDDPFEAIRAAEASVALANETMVDEFTSLPVDLSAALGIVIGAAVNCIQEAVDGAGVGSDAVQWPKRWADEAARIFNNTPHNEDYFIRRKETIFAGDKIDTAFVTPQSFASGQLGLPENYKLYLRLHNDDVHTFEDVINALFPDYLHRSRMPTAEIRSQQSLAESKDSAITMTQRVDADGQVTVKCYDTITDAIAGFRVLKKSGLQCAVVSSAQEHMESRARVLCQWLCEVAASHPVAQALVVQALVQVDEDSQIGNVSTWLSPKMIPPWAGVDPTLDEQAQCKIRFNSFPPHVNSSYLTREASELLHGIALTISPTYPHNNQNYNIFVQLTGTQTNFYMDVPYRLPPFRYRKSPHALWGTLPAQYTDPLPLASKHPVLERLTAIHQKQKFDELIFSPSRLIESVYVIDTDLRKQQEGERISVILFAHKLPGLHMISGIGTTQYDVLDSPRRPPLPSPMDWRHLLATSSFRAPLSPLLLLLLQDPYPTKQLRAVLHALFLSLLTNVRFKARFAGSLAIAYRPISTLFCAGVGTEADTPLHFTVQIFTSGSLVRALGFGPATEKLLISDINNSPSANTKNLVTTPSSSIGVFVSPIAHIIVRCIHTNLLGATKEVTMILKNTAVGVGDDQEESVSGEENNPALIPALTYVAGEHPLLTELPSSPDDGFLDSRSTKHKRLPHLLRDLDYVIETPGTALRLLLPFKYPVYQGTTNLSHRGEDCLPFSAVFSRMLRLAQGMDLQKRRISGNHVEYELQRWLEAFGLSLNFGGSRDSLTESPTIVVPISNTSESSSDASQQQYEQFILVREALGNLIASLLREIKQWLYREGSLKTGLLPVPPVGAMGDAAQNEALQRSTLHVTSSQFRSMDSSESTVGSIESVALSCGTNVRMTEAQLSLIENALKVDEAHKQHQQFDAYQPPSSDRLLTTPGTRLVIGDWLRVPHFPLAGDSLSFHLPLHRALAKCVKSICSTVVTDEIREANARHWWKIPILDYGNASNQCGPSPDTSTFHPLLALIRATVTSSNCQVLWSAGPDCTPQEAQRRRNRSRAVSSNIAAAKIIHSLADHPIRCLAAAQQIERHMWARNGAPVVGMATNYSNAPLSRSFRDLDFLLVQLSASGMGCGLGARRVLLLLLSRFSMDGYLCDPERRNVASNSGSNSSLYGSPLSTWVLPRLQEPDHALILAESVFSTICVLVTELPPPPPKAPTDDLSLKQTIRRELLHALAAEPRSHSEARAAAACCVSRREESEGITGYTGVGMFNDAFVAVLQEIGKSKNPTSTRASSGPPTFELKPEFCDEYDPAFFHLRRHEHQHAMDVVSMLRKRKWGTSKEVVETHCLPIVCAPPKAHPRFLPCRLMLHLETMDAAIRRFLLYTLTNGNWLPPVEPSPQSLSSDGLPGRGKLENQVGSDFTLTTFSGRAMTPHLSIGSHRRSLVDMQVEFSCEVVASSSVSFLEVLQLLTLQVHTLEECASLHSTLPDLDEEARVLSSGLSINSYLRRLIKVPESLVDEWAFRPHPFGPLKSKGSGENKASVLGLLIALYEHRADHRSGQASDANGPSYLQNDDDHGGARALVTSGLKWLLRFVHALADGAHSVGASIKCATTGSLAKKSRSVASAGPDTGISSTINEEVRTNVLGMLQDLPDLWPDQQASAESPEKTNEKNKEARKAAQLRVMEMMKQKQAAFAATIEPTDLPDTEKAGEGDGENDLCIICRCDENSGELGYLGHVQRSRVSQIRATTEALFREGPQGGLSSLYKVVGQMGCHLSESESLDSKSVFNIPRGSIVSVVKTCISTEFDIISRRVFVNYTTEDPITNEETFVEGWGSMSSERGFLILSPLRGVCYTNSRWGSTRPLIKQCGHAAHFKCVKEHLVLLHQRAAVEQPYDGRFAANIAEGEFVCPLCKQLSNILIPRDNALESIRNESMDIDSYAKSALVARTIRESINGSDFASKNTKQPALETFGFQIYEAMKVSKELISLRRKKWHPSIETWDYEEKVEGDDDRESSNSLRLLRQQLIAWASVGHTASAMELASRSIEKALPFGLISETSDPWNLFTKETRDDHPSLLELKRILAAASGLLEVLNRSMSEQLGGGFSSQEHVPIVGTCLVDILEGVWWGQSLTPLRPLDPLVDLWSELSSLLSSMPCHVSRDGMLPHRYEARATAAAMWVVKGTGCDGTSITDPPAPRAIAQLFVHKHSRNPIIPVNWGTMTPYVKKSEINNIRTPFRLGIACTFLYTPILAWDLCTFAGAIFSSSLHHDAIHLPTSKEILHIAQYLMYARLLQAIITPGGYEIPDEMELDDEEFWTDEEISKEGTALSELLGHCDFMLESKSLTSPSCLLGTKNTAPHACLLAGLGRAILPFARTLVLLIRALTAVIRDRQRINGIKASHEDDDANRIIDYIAHNATLMTVEDGFELTSKGFCPLPSLLVDTKQDFFSLMNRWLVSTIALDFHHGSAGRSVSINTDTTHDTVDYDANMTAPSATSLRDTKNEDCGPNSSDSINSNSQDSVVHMNDIDGVLTLRHNMTLDEDMDDFDDSDEDYGEIERNAPLFHSGNAETAESSDNSSYAADDDDDKYANVSRSFILPYQPSLLGLKTTGLGRNGTYFDLSIARGIMSDLSHLGLVHQKEKPIFSLIRLPTSFVELYDVVNKVKEQEDASANADIDDVATSEIAICLLTGTVMRSGSSGRPNSREKGRTPGACTLHARKTASGVGIFFLVQKCTVLLMHNSKSAYSPSLYVDEHGEEDISLRRGRPLYLNEARYRLLELLWRNQGIPREVAQIRSTSDRVIRDNWY